MTLRLWRWANVARLVAHETPHLIPTTRNVVGGHYKSGEDALQLFGSWFGNRENFPLDLENRGQDGLGP